MQFNNVFHSMLLRSNITTDSSILLISISGKQQHNLCFFCSARNYEIYRFHFTTLPSRSPLSSHNHANDDSTTQRDEKSNNKCLIHCKQYSSIIFSFFPLTNQFRSFTFDDYSKYYKFSIQRPG